MIWGFLGCPFGTFWVSWDPFGSLLGRLGASWGHLGELRQSAQDASKTTHGAPKNLQNDPRRLPKEILDASKRPSKGSKGLPKCRPKDNRWKIKRNYLRTFSLLWFDLLIHWLKLYWSSDYLSQHDIVTSKFTNGLPKCRPKNNRRKTKRNYLRTFSLLWFDLVFHESVLYGLQIIFCNMT